MLRSFIVPIVLLASVTIASASVMSQDIRWSKTYNSGGWDQLLDLKPTNDGGFIAVGVWTPSDTGKIWLVKFDDEGDTTWSRTFGDTLDAVGWCVQQTLDGGYIIGGDWNQAIEGCVIKTDSQGLLEWRRTFEPVRWILQVSSENYIVCGRIYSPGSYAGWLQWLDSDGVIDATHPNSSIEFLDRRVYNVVPSSDGFALCGQEGTNVHGGRVWFHRMDSLGTLEFLGERLYGGNGDTLASAWRMCMMPDSGFLLAGRRGTSEGSGDFIGDAYLVRTDASGDSLWTRSFGTPSWDDRAFDAQPTADGGAVVAGYIDGSGWGLGDDGWLLRLHPNGDTLWTSRFGAGNEDLYRDVTVMASEEYLVCGQQNRETSPFDGDGWLVRYGSNGCCERPADINHDGIGPDIADLVYLVTYMFQSGPEPP